MPILTTIADLPPQVLASLIALGALLGAGLCGLWLGRSCGRHRMLRPQRMRP